jgi:hypothetical protein
VGRRADGDEAEHRGSPTSSHLVFEWSKISLSISLMAGLFLIVWGHVHRVVD